MPENIDTRVLKDINRHLASIDKAKGAGMTDTLSPSETAALNRNVQEIMGGFSSLVDTQLKDTIKTANKTFLRAVKDLKDEGAEKTADAMDEIVDELEISNRFAAKSEHNDFLKESERETDLNINRRTNDLLEDILENEESASASAKAEADSSKGLFSGGMGGIFGGMLGGMGLKGVLKGAAKVGKKMFFPLLIAGAAAEFLRGWGEESEDSSTLDKFNSGIGRMLSDLTFGLVSKEFFEKALQGIESAISKAWNAFTADWDAFVTGKMSGPDFFSNLLSDLSFGHISPEAFKDIGKNIEEGFYDLISPAVDAVMLAFDDLVMLMFGDLAKSFQKFKDNPTEYITDLAKKALFGELTPEEKLKQRGEEAAKIRKADKSLSVNESLELARDAKNWVDAKKEISAMTGQDVSEKAVALRKSAREIRLEEKRKKRMEEVEAARVERGIKTKEKPISPQGAEALKQMIDNERALREAERRTQSEGNAVQVNSSSTTVNPVDTETENHEISLRRAGLLTPGE